MPWRLSQQATPAWGMGGQVTDPVLDHLRVQNREDLGLERSEAAMVPKAALPWRPEM